MVDAADALVEIDALLMLIAMSFFHASKSMR